jgi:hypothetical protein
MFVIFLDFDGVLNSAASFLYEDRKRKSRPEEDLGPVNETFCNVCTSNFQSILETFPNSKIVISSAWRNLYPLGWLKDKLRSYGIDSSRVIGITPNTFSSERGREIDIWLKEHPDTKGYIAIDDNDDGISYYHGKEHFVHTTWETGLTLPLVVEAIKKIKDQNKPTILEKKKKVKKDGR